MKNKKISTLILASLTLGLLTVFTVQSNALDFSVQFGTQPPRPPAPRFHARPEPVYVEYYNDAVLNLGGAYFGIDNAVVYGYSRDYNLSPDEVVYILYLSHYSHRSPTFVINVYKKYHTRGWSVMAKHLGLTRGYPRWMSNRNAPTYAVLYITSDYYDVPYSQVYGIYNRGYQPAEIVVAVNFSSQSGQPVSGILSERSKGTTWEVIAGQNKTSFDSAKQPHSQGKSVKFGGASDMPSSQSTPGGMKSSNQGNQRPSDQTQTNKSNGRGNSHVNGETGDTHKGGQMGDPHSVTVGQDSKSQKDMSNQGNDGKGQNQDQGKGKDKKNKKANNSKNKDNGKQENKDKNNDKGND